MEACILLCRSNKPIERKNKILLIKATDLVERKNSESYLTEDHINIIVNLYNKFIDIDGRSKVISTSDIPTNKYTISPKFYVKTIDGSDSEDISVLFNTWKSHSESLRSSINTLTEIL